MKIPESIEALIKDLGGPTVVGASLGPKPQTVFSWGDRGSIPPRYWPGIIRLAAEKHVFGINSDSLMLMHQPKQSPAPAPGEAAGAAS